MPNYMVQACGGWYESIDTKDIKLLTKGHSECLCVTQDWCLAAGDNGYGIGLVTGPGEICKVGCVVCAQGLKKPDACMKGAGHFLCFKHAHSCPLDNDFVGTPHCVICCAQIYPKCELGPEAPPLTSMVR